MKWLLLFVLLQASQVFASQATTELQQKQLDTLNQIYTGPLSVTGSFTATPGGFVYDSSARNVYSSTNVTTGAWVQLVAATTGVINGIMLFDSCGLPLELGVGAAASETRVAIIPPGGFDGFIPLKLPAASRISVRALSATCSVGELDLTALH